MFSSVEDDDMGVMGAEADDAESEFIRSVCEKVRGRICRVGRLSGVSGRR